jgi:replicative DNA helicase
MTDRKEYIKTSKFRPVKLLDGIEEIKQDFEERIAQGDTTYGIEILDDAVETIRKGSITFIIAAPNTGKSLCGQTIAVHLAKQNKKVLICSCEMGAGLLMERQIKQLLGVSSGELRKYYSSDKTNATKLMDELIESDQYKYLNNIYISETGGATIEDIKQLMDIFPEFEYVIIDYIQRIRGNGTEYENITNAARELQTYARDTGRKLIVCSQASRQSSTDARQGKELDPSRIRGKGSGSIEEDGDVGLSLIEDPTNNTSDKIILFTLFKNRYGSLKNISYRYKLSPRLTFDLIQRNC